ncbi:MAG: SRPBCC family protein [Planctomycetaceae bacterium]|nr:SRPBCC family protein [Planctomycetaceae bacterium]
MPIIQLECLVRAPIEIVFDLSRSIDLHVESTTHTGERAVAGRTSGLMELDERVTWEATHFGVRQRLTTRITQFDRPHHFRDSMVHGAFRRFDHDHDFQSVDDGTLMKDRFDYTSPLGPLGQLADLLFLKRYMTGFLKTRNRLIKSIAESDRATAFLHKQHDC